MDEDTLIEIFDTLEIGGLRPPWAGRGEAVQLRMGQRALKVWTALLSDQRPADLIAAAGVYLRSGERFWPTPGALLAHVPQRRQSFPDGAALFEWVVRRCAEGHWGETLTAGAAVKAGE